MSDTHIEAALNKLTKPELVQLLLKTESPLGSQISDLSKEIKDTLTHLKKLEADIAVIKIVNDRLVKRIVKTERQCWENAQYSRCDTLEIVGNLGSIDNSVLEETVRGIFGEIGVQVDKRDIQACHRMKEKDRTIVKFANRKDCLQILRVKKDLKSLDPIELDFPESTKIYINESLCPYYRGIWNKCKNLKATQKIHQFYMISGLIHVKLEETGPSRVITHMIDLKELFPDVNLKFINISWNFFLLNILS